MSRGDPNAVQLHGIWNASGSVFVKCLVMKIASDFFGKERNLTFAVFSLVKGER